MAVSTHMSVYDSPVVYVSLWVHVSLWFAHHRPHEALAQDKSFNALGKVLYLLDSILDGQVGASGRGLGGCVARGRTQDLPMMGGLSRGGLGGAEPHGHECGLVSRTPPRTDPRDRVYQRSPSVPSTKYSLAER